MFGNKISHKELQSLKDENQNLVHQLEKSKAENLELKSKISILEQEALESKLKTNLLNVLLSGVLENITIVQSDMLDNVNKAETISDYSKTSLAEMDELNHIANSINASLGDITESANKTRDVRVLYIVV